MTKTLEAAPSSPPTEPLESSPDPTESASVILLIVGLGLIGLTCWRVVGLLLSGEPGGTTGDQIAAVGSAGEVSRWLSLCGHAATLLFGAVCCTVGSLLRWA